jgi:hypothetical protein
MLCYSFISTLVTAVLTHHLGWVPTVLPGTSPPLSSQNEKPTSQMVRLKITFFLLPTRVATTIFLNALFCFTNGGTCLFDIVHNALWGSEHPVCTPDA